MGSMEVSDSVSPSGENNSSVAVGKVWVLPSGPEWVKVNVNMVAVRGAAGPLKTSSP